MHHGSGGMQCPACGCGGGHDAGAGKCGGGMMKAMFMMMPWKVIMHADELGLSEDQIEALRTRHSEARKHMIQIGSEIKIAEIDVQNAVMREEIDMAAAEAKVREIGKLKGDLFIGMIQAMQDMRHILNPGQRKKVKEMVMSWVKKGGMPGMGEQEGESCECEH